MESPLPLFDAESKVVDLAMYRAAHPRQDKTPAAVFDRTLKPVSARTMAHRQLMLRYLATQTRAAAGARD